MTSHDLRERDDAPVPANEPAANALLDAAVLPQMQTELEVRPEIDDIRKEIESHLALDEPVPPDLLRRYAALWRTTFQLHPHILSFAWPAGLYIPTEADWRNYWFAAPPSANRYGWQYPATDQVVAEASVTDGSLFAYASQLPGVVGSESYALVGASHVSPYNLAYAKASARITGVAEHHLLMQLPPAVYGTASIKGWAYLVIWQRNPVDGSWELKPPFASVELISVSGDQSGGNQQTVMGVVPRRRFDFDSGPFSTPMLLEAGREYVVGVEVRVRVDVNILDGSNRPYNIDRESGDRWFCWGDINATVPQIQIDVTNILVP